MWYRSIITMKLVSNTYFRTLDLIYGENAAESLIATGILIPVKSPTVVDILRDNGSEIGAVMRYREIHGCTLSEAREGVKILKEDMARISKSYIPRKKFKAKKNTSL